MYVQKKNSGIEALYSVYSTMAYALSCM